MKKTCQDCAHFYRHYVRIGKDCYSEIDHGHCVYPRIKNRDTDTPACEHFKERPPQENAAG